LKEFFDNHLSKMKRSAAATYWRLTSSAITLLVAVILSFPQFLSGQGYYKVEVRNTNCPVSNHEADLWYFGQNAGINFMGDLAVPLLNNDVLTSIQSCANICDSNGRLLLMTDGMRVWDGGQGLMPNGSGLHGDPGVTMPAIIIPKPNDPNIYYIFTIDRPQIHALDTNVFGLQYSEVNLTLNGGRGDVSLKNRPLVSEVCEKVTAVQDQNGTDYWVVAHSWDSDQFISIHVTEDGVDTATFVTSTAGSVHSGPISTNNSVGFMKISPDGTRLALAIHGSKKYEIFDFNSSNGRVNNAIPSPAVYSGAYGIEFSPDAHYLYTTTAFVGGLPDSVSRLFQFDVTQGSNIWTSGVELAINNVAEYFCGLQLGTDGRIYVARSPNGNMAAGVIYNPKRPGTECNFNLLNGSASDFNLGGGAKRSKYGFPAFMQSYFDVPHFDAEMVCFTDTTAFKLTNPANVTTVSWNFGDNSTGSSNTSTAMEPTHIFSAPGTYTVTVTENGTYSYSEQVYVNEPPFPTLPDTVYMYRGASVLLNAGDGFTSYEWNTGEYSSVIKVSQPGVYWVIVQNQTCCFNIDSVTVLLFDIMVPNAFRPGGTNTVFRAIPTSQQAIENFSMYIYDRWGMQIFESKEITEGWDGTYKGNPAPGDVYVWIVNYDIEREGKMERVAYKGNVILLR
jgi:gliding motility-associated-like protein